MKTPGVLGFLLLSACGDTAPTVAGSDGKPANERPVLRYHGMELRFPLGTIDALDDTRPPWARLKPGARYEIDLGRPHTGTHGPSGYALGFGFYTADAERNDLGDGYTLYCDPPHRRAVAFYCAALLKALPFAAIQFRNRPVSAGDARGMVDDAEAYLIAAKQRR